MIRALFAQEELNSPLEDLLFVSDDNERKNYLRRFEHYLKTSRRFSIFVVTMKRVKADAGK